MPREYAPLGMSRGVPADQPVPAPPVDGSHIRTPQELQIFCAALSGICANPEFFGALMQQDPVAAVRFASNVVLVTQGKEVPRDQSPF